MRTTHTGMTPESLAGMLAEASVTRLALLDAAGGWRELCARQTDLPGELRRAIMLGEVELLALDRPLRITLQGDAVEWRQEDDAGPAAS